MLKEADSTTHLIETDFSTFLIIFSCLRDKVRLLSELCPPL